MAAYRASRVLSERMSGCVHVHVKEIPSAMRRVPYIPKLSLSARRRGSSEAGYLLLGVLVLVAFVLIALAVAAPKIAVELQRDKESELYHRGLQYARAIRLYYKKFGKYPNSMEQLEKTNEIRFLRKRYRDPITGKDEWRLIHVGEAKLQATSPFSLPYSNKSSNIGGPPVPGSVAGSDPTARYGTSSGSGSSPTFGPSSTAPTDGSSGTQTDSGTSTAAGSASSGGTGSSDTNSSGIGGTGQTFGGGGVVGVASFSKKESIREYKKQTHYNQWEFLYDASQEIMGAQGTGLQTGQQSLNSSTGTNTSTANTSGPSPTPTPPSQPTPQP